MKIGILTFHTPYNFGANLQAYTSSKYFENLGHSVKVINYMPAGGEHSEQCPVEQETAHNHFSQNTLNVTREVYNGEEVYQVVKEEQFDVVAIGSDAVWNKRNRERLEIFYAKWLWGTDLEKKVRVVALSPAFMGTDFHDLTPTERESFKQALLKFSAINTRDEWTKTVVNREIIGEDFIKNVNPDPVFLLDQFCKEDWKHDERVITSKQYYAITLPKDYMNTMGTAKRYWLHQLKREVNKRGYQLVELPIPDGYSGYDGFDFVVKYPIDPLQWFLWLKNAKAFVGLRFHAVVSCISAGTPFFSLDSYTYLTTRQRILNLLGYHKKDREWAYRSKIRNIIEGSGLEEYRVNGAQVNTISAKKVVRMLESFPIDKMEAYSNLMVNRFKENMGNAINLIK